MKFKDFMDLGIKTEEGVLITKYLIDMYIANSDIAKRVKQEFVNHGYNLDIVPGEFLKIFTMNEKELAELGKILVEIDELGLDETDRKMLELMINQYQGRPVGIDSIATSLGEEVDTIEDVYEPYLIQIGFISRTPRGRIVMPPAYEHLGYPYLG